MFKISRLYYKLYIYFIVAIFSFTFIIPFIIFSYFPHPSIIGFQRNLIISDFLRNYSGDYNKEFEKELKELGKKINCHIILYDKTGKALFQTKDYKKTLSKKEIEEVKREFIFARRGPLKNINELVFSIEDENLPFSYAGVLSNPNSFSLKISLQRLFIIALLLSLIIYPVVLYVTRPLEKITRKAVKFSRGDFSELNKKIDIKGNDEIAQLNEAFSHMANELVAMIEGKKELISDISHELGSPLSRMQVSVDLIENDLEAENKPDIEDVKVLSKNISEMSKLIKELLELSRLNKAYILNIEKHNLEEIVENIVKKFDLIIKEKNINIEIKKSGDLSQVFIDRVKMARVIQNLLSNAIDYSPKKGNIEITLKDEGEHFLFSIKDEGPGISEQNKEKVFEPFFREDPSRARQTGGTGLGLAIVKKIIKLHGGNIWLVNPGEKGAFITFKV